MTKAEKTPSVLLTCAHGLSSVSESLKHHVFVTFTLHFIFFCLHTGSLDSGDRRARAREEGSPLVLLATHLLACCQKACVDGS